MMMMMIEPRSHEGHEARRKQYFSHRCTPMDTDKRNANARGGRRRRYQASTSLNHVSGGSSCRALAMNNSSPAEVVNQNVIREPPWCHFVCAGLSGSFVRWPYMLKPPRQQRTARSGDRI